MMAGGDWILFVIVSWEGVEICGSVAPTAQHDPSPDLCDRDVVYRAKRSDVRRLKGRGGRTRKKTSLSSMDSGQDKTALALGLGGKQRQQEHFGPGLAGWPRQHGHWHDTRETRQAEGRQRRRKVEVRFARLYRRVQGEVQE